MKIYMSINIRYGENAKSFVVIQIEKKILKYINVCMLKMK